MNKKLKFSWGHIIAFISLIFISYVSFMGCFYTNGGNFKESIIKVLIMDTALLTTFIGVQIIKGTDKKFGRSLILERILIILTPIVFIITMVPTNHFWNVYNQKDKIEELFNSSISDAKKMFEEYDIYANNRIYNYSNLLDILIEDKVRKDSYRQTLQLQLLSQNSIELQAEANKWLDKANNGISVWNAFLIGNIEHISDAIKTWNEELTEYSIPVLSNERLRENEVSSFDINNSSLEGALNNLNNLALIYKNSKGISFRTILFSPLLFLMLLLPYLLQKRDGKAHGIYYLTKKKRSESQGYTIKGVIPNNNDLNKEEDLIKKDSKSIYTGTF